MSSRTERLVCRAGQRDADGIRREAGVAAAEGRHETTVIGDVHGSAGDTSPAALGQLAVGAHTTDVMGIGEGERDHAGLPAALDRGRHRFAGHAAAVATAPVEHQHGAVVLHDLGRRVGHDELSLEVSHVCRDHAHAVTVVAGEVGLHQCGRRRGRPRSRRCHRVR
jgi:hypothetical protein